MSIACTSSVYVDEVAPVRRAVADNVLLKRIAKGDQAALRTLVERHQARVYRFAMRFVRDTGLAEDVVSETFFAVWQSAATFRDRSAVSTWLLSIARYKALAMRERIRETTESLDDDTASRVADPAPRVDTAIEQRDLVTFIRDCLH